MRETAREYIFDVYTYDNVDTHTRIHSSAECRRRRRLCVAFSVSSSFSLRDCTLSEWIFGLGWCAGGDIISNTRHTTHVEYYYG